jgi:hypothetical protein
MERAQRMDRAETPGVLGDETGRAAAGTIAPSELGQRMPQGPTGGGI